MLGRRVQQSSEPVPLLGCHHQQQQLCMPLGSRLLAQPQRRSSLPARASQPWSQRCLPPHRQPPCTLCHQRIRSSLQPSWSGLCRPPPPLRQQRHPQRSRPGQSPRGWIPWCAQLQHRQPRPAALLGHPSRQRARLRRQPPSRPAQGPLTRCCVRQLPSRPAPGGLSRCCGRQPPLRPEAAAQAKSRCGGWGQRPPGGRLAQGRSLCGGRPPRAGEALRRHCSSFACESSSSSNVLS